MPAETPHQPGHQEALDNAVRVSRTHRAVRACMMTTADRDHALRIVRDTAINCQVPLRHFSVVSRRRYDPSRMNWVTEPHQGESTSYDLLRAASELRDGGIVILEDCAAQLRDEGGDQRMRARLAQLLSADEPSPGLVLVFLEPPAFARHLPATLADQFLRIEVAHPRREELETIARDALALSNHMEGRAVDVERIQSDARTLGTGLVGLTRTAARDCLRDALIQDADDIPAANRRLQIRKAAQLRRELAMNILDPDDAEMPIGLDRLEEFLHISRHRILASGQDRSKGILMIGPPGTGKTLLARAIGRQVGLPVVEFRISALMNSLLGETERRFAQAFDTLAAMSPNVVFIDEIEKAFGDSTDRDGGTMMRCTGALLSWLQDNPNPNFIVATSNSLRRMGEIGLTMSRSGRFDRMFFVDVPNRKSRCRMIRRWIGNAFPNADTVADDLARRTERFSGADLFDVVKLARMHAEAHGIPLAEEHLSTQIERKRLRAQALYDEFQGLRQWGRIYCDPAGSTDD